jgi:hypothetical protein
MAHDVTHVVAAHGRAPSSSRRGRVLPVGSACWRARGRRRSQAARDCGADLALSVRRLDGGTRGARGAQFDVTHRVCLCDGGRRGARRAALAGAHCGGRPAECLARGGNARGRLDEPRALCRARSRWLRRGARGTGSRVRAECTHLSLGNLRALPLAASQGHAQGACGALGGRNGGRTPVHPLHEGFARRAVPLRRQRASRERSGGPVSIVCARHAPPFFRGVRASP